MTQLLPCPFCGCSKLRRSRNDGDERTGYNVTDTIKCEKCGCSMSLGTEHNHNGWCIESYESLVERLNENWNTRVTL